MVGGNRGNTVEKPRSLAQVGAVVCKWMILCKAKQWGGNIGILYLYVHRKIGWTLAPHPDQDSFCAASESRGSKKMIPARRGAKEEFRNAGRGNPESNFILLSCQPEVFLG